MNGVELNEKEAHCVARLLQGAWFGDDVLDACQFCKYQCFKEAKDNNYIRVCDEIRKKFTEATGVDLGYIHRDLEGIERPYVRFLKNSNDDIKKMLRDYFKRCIAVE